MIIDITLLLFLYDFQYKYYFKFWHNNGQYYILVDSFINTVKRNSRKSEDLVKQCISIYSIFIIV